MKNSTFKIEGMHCDGCANTIKALIDEEPRVQTVAVSFKDGLARVLYDPQVTSDDRLAAAIQKPGYRVVGRQ